jgi:hypothetical protein
VAHGRLSFWSVKLTKDGSQKENYVVTHVKGCDKERLPQRAITNSAPEILANTFVHTPFPTLTCCHPPWTNTTISPMLVSKCHNTKKTLTHPNPDNRLEEWMNTRNTKNQYSKQLRNFLKVSIPAINLSNEPY